MKVLYVGSYDYGNLCHRHAGALNLVGIQTRIWVAHRHPFGYGDEEPWVGDETQASMHADAMSPDDWICYTGDGADLDVFERILRDGCKARRAVFWPGTFYRQRPDHLNGWADAMDIELVWAAPDLVRFRPGAWPVRQCGWTGPILDPQPMHFAVSHSPSRRDRKGTAEILSAYQAFLAESSGTHRRLELIEGVGYEECLRRRAACPVFIDQLTPDIGAFSSSAAEALCQGLAVISDLRHCDAAWPEMARPPVMSVQDEVAIATNLHLLHDHPWILERNRTLAVEYARCHLTALEVGKYVARVFSDGKDSRC